MAHKCAGPLWGPKRNQGSNEDLPVCSWHGGVDEFEYSAVQLEGQGLGGRFEMNQAGRRNGTAQVWGVNRVLSASSKTRFLFSPSESTSSPPASPSGRQALDLILRSSIAAVELALVQHIRIPMG